MKIFKSTAKREQVGHFGDEIYSKARLGQA